MTFNPVSQEPQVADRATLHKEGHPAQGSLPGQGAQGELVEPTLELAPDSVKNYVKLCQKWCYKETIFVIVITRIAGALKPSTPLYLSTQTNGFYFMPPSLI